MTTRNGIARWLAVSWSLSTAIFLVVIAVGILSAFALASLWFA